MNRDYANQNHNDDTKFFVGTEVENTLAKGKETLFVVGLEDPAQIVMAAKQLKCEAVYFGANHSFDVGDSRYDDWKPWEDMIMHVLNDDEGLFCTLDLDVKDVLGAAECVFTTHNNFILMVSVKIPYVQQLGYNTVVKIDDIDFNKSNPGVWCHPLSDLTKNESFTHWSKYRDDKTV